ncbi:hypothetical protein R6Q59_001515 [Mikania micrantha]
MTSSRTEHGRIWWRSSCPPRSHRHRTVSTSLPPACTAAPAVFGPPENKSTPFLVCCEVMKECVRQSDYWFSSPDLFFLLNETSSLPLIFTNGFLSMKSLPLVSDIEIKIGEEDQNETEGGGGGVVSLVVSASGGGVVMAVIVGVEMVLVDRGSG